MIIDALMSMRVDKSQTGFGLMMTKKWYKWFFCILYVIRENQLSEHPLGNKLKNYFVIHVLVLCALYQGSIIQTCVENFKFKIKQQTEVLNIIAVLSWLC